MLVDNYTLSLLLFSVSMVATPGPANIILLNAGSQFGFKKSLPFVLGIILSKQIIIWPIGFGLLNITIQFPNVIIFFKVISAIYITYLAWKIAGSSIKPSSEITTPPNFLSGIIIHPINPKAWAMVTVSFTTFAPKIYADISSIIMISLIFLSAHMIFHPLWVVFGAIISNRLKGTLYEKYLMRLLALLTIGSLAVVLISD